MEMKEAEFFSRCRNEVCAPHTTNVSCACRGVFADEKEEKTKGINPTVAVFWTP